MILFTFQDIKIFKEYNMNLSIIKFSLFFIYHASDWDEPNECKCFCMGVRPIIQFIIYLLFILRNMSMSSSESETESVSYVDYTKEQLILELKKK